MNSTKKILVTGGAGFLGSHLCERLMALGHSVVCVDNFFTGTKSNIKNIVKERKFTLIRHDIIEPINTMKIDQIYNLACPASPVHYQHDPVKTVRTNVQGSINVLNLAKKYKLRIFQASTSEVYAGTLNHYGLDFPTPESTPLLVSNPREVRTSYMLSKIYGEAMCLQ